MHTTEPKRRVSHSHLTDLQEKRKRQHNLTWREEPKPPSAARSLHNPARPSYQPLLGLGTGRLPKTTREPGSAKIHFPHCISVFIYCIFSVSLKLLSILKIYVCLNASDYSESSTFGCVKLSAQCHCHLEDCFPLRGLGRIFSRESLTHRPEQRSRDGC